MSRQFGFFRRADATAITFDVLTPLYNSVQIEHDFGGTTEEIELFMNGEQQIPLRYNPIDTKHYGIGYFPESTAVSIEITDTNGDARSASTTTLTTPSRPTVSRTRYVTPGGTGDYSSGNPGSLDGALSSEADGDRIICKAGTYHLGDMVVHSSATVIIEADDAATVVISGFRDTQPSSWTDETGGEYSTTDFDTTCRLVCFEESGTNQQLAWKDNRTELASAAHGWTISASTLYVKLPGSLDPNGETMKISNSYKNGIRVDSDNTWIEDLIFEGYGAGSGITSRSLIVAGDSVHVLNCTFRDNLSEGLRVSTGNNALIDGTTHSMGRKYMDESDIKSVAANYRSEQGAAISLATTTGSVVRNITASGMMDVLVLSAATYCDLYDNTFTDCYGETVSIEGTNRCINRWGNTLTRCQYMIGYATMNGGPCRIVNDNSVVGSLTVIDTAAAASLILQGTKFNSGTPGTVGQLFLINCTIDATNPSSGNWTDARTISIENTFPMGDWYSRNCVFSGEGHPFYDENSSGVFDMNWSRWYTTNAYGETTQLWRWKSATYAADFSAFQTASSQEANGSYGDPNLTGGVPSPTIAGTHIPGITGNVTVGVTTATAGAQ